jgi:recombination protein RecT
MTVSALKTAIATKAEKPTTIHGFLESYKGEIARALPKHLNADRMARVALTECRKTPALLKCKPESLFGAIIQAAQLGLEPGGAMGHAYLIPFGQEVQFIVGYRGMIDLARRSGQIVSLEAHAVYEGDTFECVFGLDSTLKHVPDWQNANRANPDKLRFVYAVAKLKDGGTQFEVMARAEVDAIRARSKAGRSGPWVTDYAAMALKTVIRRLFKYLPVSIEIQKAVALDETVDANLSQGNEYVITGEAVTVDNDAEFKTDEIATEDKAKHNGIAFAAVSDALNKAGDIETLDLKADLIRQVDSEEQRAELTAEYKRLREVLAQEVPQ